MQSQLILLDHSRRKHLWTLATGTCIHLLYLHMLSLTLVTLTSLPLLDCKVCLLRTSMWPYLIFCSQDHGLGPGALQTHKNCAGASRETVGCSGLRGQWLQAVSPSAPPQPISPQQLRQSRQGSCSQETPQVGLSRPDHNFARSHISFQPVWLPELDSAWEAPFPHDSRVVGPEPARTCLALQTSWQVHTSGPVRAEQRPLSFCLFPPNTHLHFRTPRFWC